MKNDIKRLFSIENYLIAYIILIITAELFFIPPFMISIGNIFFYLTSFPIAGYIIYKRYKENPLRKIDIVLFLLLLVFFCSIIWNHTLIIDNIKSFAITIIQCVITFYYIMYADRDNIKLLIRRVIKVFLIYIFIISCVNIVLYILGLDPNPGYLRYNGVFTTSISSCICAFAASLCLLLIINTDDHKAFYIISIIVHASYISLANSRGSILFMFITFAIMYITYAFMSSGTFTKKIAISILLCGGSFVLYQILDTQLLPNAYGMVKMFDSSQVSNIEERDDYTNSNNVRMDMMKAGLNTFKNHSLFGVTSRNLADVVAKENPEYNLKGIKVAGLHNSYLQILVSNGLLGFSLFLILMLMIMGDIIKRIFKNPKLFYLVSIAAAFAVYMFIAVVPFYFIGVMGIALWFVLGMLMREDTMKTELREMNDEEIKEYQLRVLDEISDFCEANGLKYSLFYGTLIGAVRHHGYIPWDDDIDIIMPRPDYEKLLKTFKSDHVKIGDFTQDKRFLYPYGKAYHTDTLLVEYANVNHDYPLGVNIDIFPYDCEMLEKTKQKQTILRKMLTLKMVRLSRNRNLKKNIILFCSKILLIPFSKERIINKMIINAKLIAFDINKNLGAMAVGNLVNVAFKGTEFLNITKLDFENKKYNVLANYDYILKDIYGDYMQFPPKDQQVPHHNYKAYFKK